MDIYKYKQANKIILIDSDTFNKKYIVDKTIKRIFEVTPDNIHWDSTYTCKFCYDNNIDNLATILYILCLNQDISPRIQRILSLFEIKYM